jgi:tRNA pseudouridine55 synthase
MATGLLLVLVGPATRLERYLSGCEKSYEATIAFGETTDTLDADGSVVDTAPVPDEVFDPAYARDLLARFLGPQHQVPPAYSAIKTDGVAAYRRARAGQAPVLAPRPVTVYEATLLRTDPAARTWDVVFRVSAGTYVRALARDIGEAAGTVAHLAALRRTRIGAVDLASAVTIGWIRENGPEKLPSLFIDPVPLLGMPVRLVEPLAVRNGATVPLAEQAYPEGTAVAMMTPDRLLAIYRVAGQALRAETVIPGGVCR